MTDSTLPIPAAASASAPPVTPLRWRVNRYGDRVLEAVNGETFDKLGARLTLQDAFRGQLDKPDTLYIIAGSDSGHLIEHVKRLSPPAGTRYLFVDPPDIYAALAAEGVCNDLPPHVRCAPANAWSEAAQALRLGDYLYIDGAEVIFSLAARSADALPYVELAWELREEVASLRWQALGTQGSEAFIACQLVNAADNVQSAAVWRGALPGATGVLLAGGPSLDAALDWVQQHRQALVVLAVSRISRRLLEVGLEPDFVVSVDPTDMCYEISREMLRFGPSVVFINQYHVNPRLLGQWPHRSFFLGNLLTWQSPLNPPEALHGAGPTVTNTALEFAAALGLSRLVLAGVDLCFTPEGFTHALGSNERQVGPRFDLTQLEVETNDGRRASTTADFATAVQMLGMQAQRLAAQGLEIVNPAPGAARIPGVTHLPLANVAIPGVAIERPLRCPSDADTPERRLRHAQAVIREFQRKRAEIDQLESELRHARRIVDKVFETDGTIRNRNLKKRLDRLERDIDTRYPDTANLIRSCGLHAFLRAMKSTQDIDNLDANDVREALAAYYETYLHGAARLRNLIQRGIDRARLRIKEYTSSAPLAELSSQWLAIGEPGRWMRWRQNHPEQADNENSAEREVFASLLHAWQTELNQQDGQHLARARAHADLRAARARLEHLFAQRKTDGIRNLIHGLECVHDPSNTAPYLALARGYLAELEGQQHDAMANYETVLQSSERELWTPALVRIAHWALCENQVEHAEQALQCLAGLSAQYWPAYGDLLAAIGQWDKAITQYQKYLQTYPQDIYAMARLVRLLMQAGATEAALPLLEYLQQRPDAQDLSAELRSLFANMA